MKLKFQEIVGSSDALKAISNCSLPIKISYSIGKLINGPITRELKIYDEQRIKLVTEYGTKDENGGTSVKPDKIEEFAKKLQELLDVEIEIEWTKIKIEDLGDIKLEPKNIVPWIFE
jgi:hypothetical protein